MILFALIVLYLFLSGLKTPSPETFSKSKVDLLKPFLAVGIVLHHLNGESVVMREFERWGPLIVGIFFFISGYGLSYGSKRDGYLNNFLYSKVVKKLVFPLLLAVALDFLLNGIWTGFDLKSHIFNPDGPYLIPNDWFIYALIYCYIAFFGAMKTRGRTVQTVIIFVSILSFVVFASLSGFARNWWATPMAFCLGFIFQDKEPKLIRCLARVKRRVVINIVWMLFLLGLMVCSNYFKTWTSVSTAAAYSTIPLWVVTILAFYRLNSTKRQYPFITLIGSLSFELYLMHGIVIRLLHRITPFEGMLFVVTALGLSIVAAYLFGMFRSYTLLAFQKLAIAKYHE